jgi:hypothetical protein
VLLASAGGASAVALMVTVAPPRASISSTKQPQQHHQQQQASIHLDVMRALVRGPRQGGTTPIMGPVEHITSRGDRATAPIEDISCEKMLVAAASERYANGGCSSHSLARRQGRAAVQGAQANRSTVMHC